MRGFYYICAEIFLSKKEETKISFFIEKLYLCIRFRENDPEIP